MAENSTEPRTLERISVLIVDDNENMRRLLHTLLRAGGITAINEAESVKEALLILFNSRIDIIITDFAMRPYNGIDFVRLLRNDPDSPARNLPVIMLTGHAEESMVIKARAAGATDFLAKPVSAKVLKEHIERIVLSAPYSPQ
jgi:CheY-like chemotaxis protein